MFRLTVVTCLVLGTALAKPPPSNGLKDEPTAVPFQDEPTAVPFQDEPTALPFQDEPTAVPLKDPKDVPLNGEGERVATFTLAPGRYYFTSPNYSDNYPNNYDTSFTVEGDSGQDITITCDPFRMESHSSCGYDFLSINEQKYCGTNAPPTTTASELRIRIKTDYSVTYSGFYCLLTVAPGSSCQCGQQQTSRVVGGTDAVAGEFSWQVGMVNPGGTRTYCGGSIINDRYVLTAAHCTEGTPASQIQVLLGDLNIGSPDAGEQRFSVVLKIEHPQYTDVANSGWDFSLLKLDREITFSSTISPVCLPTAGETYAGATAIASGYGQVGEDQPQATVLQHVQLPVWSNSACKAKWGFLKTNMICAGGYDEGGRAVCRGDSGGPLVTEVSGRFRLIGVVSFGNPCAVAGWPDVFARVTEALPWIAANTQDASTCSP